MQRLLWVSAGGLRKLAQEFVEIAKPLDLGDSTAVAEDQTKGIFSVEGCCMTVGRYQQN